MLHRCVCASVRSRSVFETTEGIELVLLFFTNFLRSFIFLARVFLCANPVETDESREHAAYNLRLVTNRLVRHASRRVCVFVRI